MMGGELLKLASGKAALLGHLAHKIIRQPLVTAAVRGFRPYGCFHPRERPIDKVAMIALNWGKALLF